MEVQIIYVHTLDIFLKISMERMTYNFLPVCIQQIFLECQFMPDEAPEAPHGCPDLAFP